MEDLQFKLEEEEITLGDELRVRYFSTVYQINFHVCIVLFFCRHIKFQNKNWHINGGFHTRRRTNRLDRQIV